MHIFEKKYKSIVLQGRTIRYLANNKLDITEQYLCQILSGKKGCSLKLAKKITKCILENAKVEDYFKKGE